MDPPIAIDRTDDHPSGRDLCRIRQEAAKRSRLFPPAALVTSPVESFSRVVGSTLGLRIPDRRVHDVLEQLIAPGHVPIRIGELARFDDELAPLAVRVLRRRRAHV